MIAIVIGFLYDGFHLARHEVPEVGFVIYMKFHPNDTKHGSDYIFLGTRISHSLCLRLTIR